MNYAGLADLGIDAARAMSGKGESMRHSWKQAGKATFAWQFQAPLAVFAAAASPRGTKLSAAGGQLAPMLGSAIGGYLGGLPGMFVGGFIGDTLMQTGVGKGLQWLHDYDSRMQRLGMGGDYNDTRAAFTMRQRAAAQMSTSLLNARQYLGREAALLHD